MKRILDSYYLADDLKNALYDIGEPMVGTKDVLINRLILAWPEHNRDLKDLLEYMPTGALEAFCQFYKLDDSGTEETLIRRIVKSGVVEPFKKSGIPSSTVVDKVDFTKPGESLKVAERPLYEHNLRKIREDAPNKSATHETKSAKSKRIIKVVGLIAGIATIISVVIIFYDRLFP